MVVKIPGPDKETLKLFFERAKPDLPALHTYALFGNIISMVGQIRAQGAETINISGPRGNTPLHFAALGVNKAAIEILLSWGANPFLENEDGGTYRDILDLTSEKNTYDKAGYPCVETAHISALNLFKTWCFFRPNPLATISLAPDKVRVISPSDLEVRVIKAAGRVLWGIVPAGTYIGPYTGSYELRGLFTEKACIVDDESRAEIPIREGSGEYRLGPVNAADWGNETALAPDGSAGRFRVFKWRGHPYGAYFIEILRATEGPVTVDYGDWHLLPLAKEYTDLEPEINQRILKEVISTPLTLCQHSIWISWAVSRPRLLLNWLKAELVCLNGLATLYRLANADNFLHTLKVLDLLEPQDSPIFIDWLEDMLDQASALNLYVENYHKLQERTFSSFGPMHVTTRESLLEVMDKWRPNFSNYGKIPSTRLVFRSLLMV